MTRSPRTCPPRRIARLLPVVVAGCAVALIAGCMSERDYRTLRKENAEADRTGIAEAAAKPPQQPLSLQRAVTLSLEHHLMAAVARREAEVEAELATAAKRKMLFEVRAEARRRRRNDVQASSSESLETGRESLEPSISSEKLQTTSKLTLAWNVLDFGVSYLQWRKATSQARILNWQLNRTRQNLVLDVTRAWCAAAVAQEAAERAAKLSALADERIRKIDRLVRDQSINEVDALEHQKRLVRIRIQLGAFERDLAEAKAELGELVGFAPGAAYTLERLDPEMGGDLPAGDIARWEQEALWNRPELYQGDLRERMAVADVRMSVLRMFPSVNFFARFETDSNRFLHRNHWNEIGVDAAYNILQLPQRWSERAAARGRVELERERRMAQAVGILAQTRLAYLLHDEAQETQRLARTYTGIQENLVGALERRVEEGQATQDQVFAAEVDAFLARIRLLRATSDLVTAGTRFYNTLGRDPLPGGGWAPRVAKPLASGLWTPPEGWDPAEVDLDRIRDRHANPPSESADGSTAQMPTSALIGEATPGSPEAMLRGTLEGIPGYSEIRAAMDACYPVLRGEMTVEEAAELVAGTPGLDLESARPGDAGTPAPAEEAEKTVPADEADAGDEAAPAAPTAGETEEDAPAAAGPDLPPVSLSRDAF